MMEKIVFVPSVFFMKILVFLLAQLVISQQIKFANHANTHVEPVKVQEASAQLALMDLPMIKSPNAVSEQTDVLTDKLSMEKLHVFELALKSLSFTKIVAFFHALLDMTKMDLEDV